MTETTRRAARLCLADGTSFEGWAVGAEGTATGEVVFTTGMTGYQEVVTDPSFRAQLVTLTAPQIGNTGVNAEDPESRAGTPQAAGLIVREASAHPSSWRADASLDAYLAKHGVCGIEGIDTRRLTRHLRDHGSQNGAIGTASADDLVDQARATPAMLGRNLVREVTPDAPYRWTEGRGSWSTREPAEPGSLGHVVVVDLGIKRNILRTMVDHGFALTGVPASMSAADILALDPDGIFVSSGPGDPAALDDVTATLRDLLGKRPIFGICLGHQLLARAAGATTYKLKFGHRGLNQPVKDLGTGRVEITSQNHGFCVDLASLDGRAVSTHVHLNDGTSEGLAIEDADAFSVQYHPEAAAGPHDSLYLFERFAARLQARRGNA